MELGFDDEDRKSRGYWLGILNYILIPILQIDQVFAGWRINTRGNYLAFMSKLDAIFFDHLRSVICFSLRVDEPGPTVLEGMRHGRLPLNPKHVPYLQSIYLEHISICEKLVGFLVIKFKTLQNSSGRKAIN